MTNKITLIIFLILASAQSMAQENGEAIIPVRSQKFDRETVKKALLILLESGALTFPEHQCPQVDKSLIHELRDQGLIEVSPATPAVICINPPTA